MRHLSPSSTRAATLTAFTPVTRPKENRLVDFGRQLCRRHPFHVSRPRRLARLARPDCLNKPGWRALVFSSDVSDTASSDLSLCRSRETRLVDAPTQSM